MLGRALTLLVSFAADDAELSLAELSRRTGIPKATVHRLVTELAGWGILEQTPAGVRLGMRLFELGLLAPRQRGIREAALPYVNDLHEATRETVHLAVLDGVEVVYLEKLAGRGGPALPSRTGGRMPAHCTGVGKALLAYAGPEVVDAAVAAGLGRLTPRTIVSPALLRRELGDIQRSGLAFDREESTPGVVCVASPVLGPDGSPVAALSITGWAARLDTARVSAAVRTATLAITRQLGAAPARPPDGGPSQGSG